MFAALAAAPGHFITFGLAHIFESLEPFWVFMSEAPVIVHEIC